MLNTRKTSLKKIATYWKENPFASEFELNFDWDMCDTHCWNCGDDKRSMSNPKKVRLERAHIIPRKTKNFPNGGEDIPSNYVLLCKECHEEAPDCINPKYMFDWIKGNRTKWGLTNTYRWEKAFDLFEQRQQIPFAKYCIENDFKDEYIINLIKKHLDNAVQLHGFKFSAETRYALVCEVYDSLKSEVKQKY
jgi:hypothetical protein